LLGKTTVVVVKLWIGVVFRIGIAAAYSAAGRFDRTRARYRRQFSPLSPLVANGLMLQKKMPEQEKM